MDLSNEGEVAVIPSCADELKPVLGKKFNTLQDGIAFYDSYARAAGFDTRKQGNKTTHERVVWQYLVCNREGQRKNDAETRKNVMEGFVNKRRRSSKRCECKARMSLKYFSEGVAVGYVINDLVVKHNHSMIELPHRRFMHLNHKLGEVHRKFTWECSKANIGPTMTFKFLNEFLGGYDTVGITVTELRNCVRGLKTHIEGSDAQMMLDEMRRKKAI